MPEPAILQREIAAFLGGDARCLLKLIVTRGVAAGRGYRPTGSERPTRILSRYDWPVPLNAEFRVHRSPVPLGSNPLLAGIKHLNRLEQVLAQRAAALAGVDEALQACESGEIISGTMSNLFLVQDDVWLTPPLERCGVAGIMRSLVLSFAASAGVQVREATLLPAQLAQAPSIVLSNVRFGLQAVHWYEGRRLTVPPSLARVWEAIDGATN
jgi:4-amino-4-deoxychorismate lyase